MRFDFTPYNRSSVGFDRVFSLLDQINGEAAPSYPPYNIERLSETAYRISVAVAGFTDRDLTIEVNENALTIRGQKGEEADKREFLHQGIAARAFDRRFQLADYVYVKGARLENGLLHVDLVREVPEALKPRTITIESGKDARVIEANAA